MNELQSGRGCVVVTGAAAGIGRAAVAALLDNGWSVLALDRDAAGLDQLRDERAAGGGLAVQAADLTETGRAEGVIADLPASVSLKGLVCSAARGDNTRFLDLSIDAVRAIFDLNVFATMALCQAAGRRMAAGGGGAIVNVTSVSGLRANAGRAAYGSSKAALEMVSKIMAVELAPQKVRVNTVAPGPTLTAMAAQLHAGPERQRLLDTVPMGRYASPEEIAQGIAYLIDDRRSAYVTGHTLCVDGGMFPAGSFEPVRGPD